MQENNRRKYGYNPTWNRIHLTTCNRYKEAESAIENLSLEKLYQEIIEREKQHNTHRELKYCHTCLRNDQKVHELVEGYNKQKR